MRLLGKVCAVLKKSTLKRIRVSDLQVSNFIFPNKDSILYKQSSFEDVFTHQALDYVVFFFTSLYHLSVLNFNFTYYLLQELVFES